MLIRSQNKEFLINFDHSFEFSVMDNQEEVLVTVAGLDETITIGRYSTKEKAIKVLDMIQDANLGGASFFQMPDNSEVLKDSPKKVAARAIRKFVAYPNRIALTDQFMDDLKLAAEVLEGLE